MCEETKTQRGERKRKKKWREIKAPHEKNKEGLKKVSVMLGHVLWGKRTPVRLCARHRSTTALQKDMHQHAVCGCV